MAGAAEILVEAGAERLTLDLAAIVQRWRPPDFNDFLLRN
jgi:hypothetical protein